VDDILEFEWIEDWIISLGSWHSIFCDIIKCS